METGPERLEVEPTDFQTMAEARYGPDILWPEAAAYTGKCVGGDRSGYNPCYLMLDTSREACPAKVAALMARLLEAEILQVASSHAPYAKGTRHGYPCAPPVKYPDSRRPGLALNLAGRVLLRDGSYVVACLPRRRAPPLTNCQIDPALPGAVHRRNLGPEPPQAEGFVRAKRGPWA